MSPQSRFSLALALLPHAGLAPAPYAAARATLLRLLAPLGGPCAVVAAADLRPHAVRATISTLLADEPVAEVAA